MHMDNKPLWHDAAAMSARAHRSQVRRDGATPYAAHPARVAMIVATVFGVADEEVIAAAYLHDVIEDCDHDYDDIHEQFGRTVADLVAAMSKDMRMVEPDREVAYDRQLAAGPWQARMIKLADVYDNLSDAEDEGGRRKMIGKAQRALELAAADEPLADSRRMVEQLIDRVLSELGDASRLQAGNR